MKIEDVKKISLKPGQVLVVRIDKIKNERHAHEMYSYLEYLFPNNGILIVDKTAEFMIIDHSQDHRELIKKSIHKE
jgi:hypothetical protein